MKQLIIPFDPIETFDEITSAFIVSMCWSKPIYRHTAMIKMRRSKLEGVGDTHNAPRSSHVMLDGLLRFEAICGGAA